MADYSKTTNFTAKDSLLTGDPNKIVKGSEHDTEYDAIAVAIATKVDQAGTGLSVAAKTVNFDITALTNETAMASGDEFLFYDASAAAHRVVTYTALHTALATSLAGTASASGIRTNAGVLTLDLDSLTNVTPAATDEFAVADASDSGNPKAVTFSAVEAALNHDSLAGFVADEHVAHSGVTMTAGNGLTGGGTIAASRSFAVGAGTGISVGSTTVSLDISGLTAMTVTPVGTDGFLYDDGGTMKRMSYNQCSFPSRNVSTSGNFASTDVGTIVYWTGTSGTLTMPSGIGQDEAPIVVINSGSGTLTIAGSGVTITSANSLTDIPAGGMAALVRESSTVWFLGGSLQ